MKWITCLCCLGLGASAFAADEPQAPASGPRITFEQTKHDFGTVDPQSLKWTFKFKNTGTQTLEVKGVQPGCGCTVIPDFDKKVEPGQEGKITAEVNASTFRGHIDKGINVTSNDPKTPNVHLSLVADIKVDLMVLPQPHLYFTHLQTTTVTNQSVEIRSALPQPLVIESVESSVPWLTAEAVSSTTNSARIQVNTKPPLLSGMQGARIIAHTKYEKYKDVVINVTVQVPPTIAAVPKELVFLKAQSNKVVEVSLLLVRNDDKNFAITAVESDLPQIQCTIQTNQPGREYRLNVTYVPKDGVPPANGRISVLTDEPAWPKVEIPCSFR